MALKNVKMPECQHVLIQDTAEKLNAYVIQMMQAGWELHPMSRVVNVEVYQGILTVVYIWVKYMNVAE